MSRAAFLFPLAMSWTLAIATQAWAAPAAGGPGGAMDATVTRCFELRSSQPAAAIALAESALADGGLPIEAEIKLQACLSRAAAVAGDARRTVAAAERIDTLLAEHPMPPEFSLRALSNAGAALHMVGRLHEALDFYARAYEVAAEDESGVAQVTTLINVGSLHSEELGAHADAEAYFARAAQLEAGTDGRNPLLPYNRGQNYLRMGRDDEALAAFEDAEAKAVPEGHEVVRQRAQAEIIALRARGAGVAAARRELEAAAGRQQAQQDPSGAAITLLRASRLALAAGDAAAALRQALAAKAVVADGVFRTEQRDALQAEAAARAALGQWSRAYAISEELRRLEIDRLRMHQLAGLAGLQARLQDSRSEQELARLRDERRLETLRLENARLLRNIAIAAFCLLALLTGAFFLYQRRVNRKLQHLSTVDSLTGLLNRRAGESSLKLADVGVADDDRRSVVFLIDVDRFKDYNDQHGHAAGDAILAATAARLRAACRPGDIVSRWGGEEFLVGCRGLDESRAAIVAERLRAAARGQAPGQGEPAPVSVSIGFACVPFLPDAAQAGGWQEAVSLADRALYAAKHGGRDTWVGLWGTAGSKAMLASVLADPEAHARAGDLSVLAARTPVLWVAPPA